MGLTMEQDFNFEHKPFLGIEFLTWLYFTSEAAGGAVSVKGLDDIAVRFERFITLQSGEGDSTETLSIRGLSSRLSEAKEGLKRGKKVVKARISLGFEQEEWSFTIDAATFDITSLKLKASKNKFNSQDPDEAALSRSAEFFERSHLVEKLLRALEYLFQEFLRHRLSPEKWQAEITGFRRWVGAE